MLLMDEPELYARKPLKSSPGQLSMFTGLQHTGTAADFREDLHPRDDDGKFRPKGVAKPGQGPTVEESPTGQRKRTVKSSAGQLPLPLGDDDVAEAKRLIQQMRGEAGPRSPLAEGEKPFTLRGGKPEPVKPSGNTVQKPLFGEKPAAPIPAPPVGKAQQKPLFGEEKPATPDVAAKAPDVSPAQGVGEPAKPYDERRKDYAAQVLAAVKERLAAGERVLVPIYGKPMVIDQRHADMLKTGGASIYIKSGNSWADIGPDAMASWGKKFGVERPEMTDDELNALDFGPQGPTDPFTDEELAAAGVAREPEAAPEPPKTTPADPEFSLSAKPKHTPAKIEGMGKARQVDLFAGRGDSPGQTSFFDDIDPAAKNVGAMEKKPEQATEAAKAEQPKAKEPWEMTRAQHETHRSGIRKQKLAEWNAAGGKGFPPTVGDDSIGVRTKLAEDSGLTPKSPEFIDAVTKGGLHSLHVRAAIAAGKPVPPEVLAEYPDLAKRPADPHAELIERAGKFAEYGENYNRNIAAPLNRLLEAKAKGHSQRMLDGMAEELRMRLDVHGSKANKPADPDIDALAKSAVDANENVWTHAKSAGHNPIKDWTPEQRQAYSDAVAKHREAAQPPKPEPSEGRARAMAAQKQRDEAGTNVKHSPAMQEAIKQASEKLGIAPADDTHFGTGRGANFKPKPSVGNSILSPDFSYKIENDADLDADEKLLSSKIVHRKIGKHHPLWRVSVVGHSDGRTYSLVENGRDMSGGLGGAVTRFYPVDDSLLESRQLDPINKIASDAYRDHKAMGSGSLFGGSAKESAPAPAADTQPKPETPAPRPLDDKIASSGGLIAKIGKQMGVKPQDMEDFISDVQLKAIQGQGGYDASKGEFSTWLGTIARNHKMTQQTRASAAKRAGVTQSLATPNESGKGSLADTVAAKETARESGDAIDLEKIRGVMGQLPDKQRQAFEAVVTGGKSVTEAAEEMGISKQAVSAYINLAKVKIKAAVGVEDEQPAQAQPEPQKPAQTLAEKVAAQRASGKKAAPPKAKPKPKAMVSMSGGNYELVKQNDDGTVTVKNDQGDEFTSEPGEDFTVAGPEPRKSAWKKNEDGTYTAPNGVVWKKAAEGGEVSPITGEPFKGGRLMPIHGLHQKQPDKPKQEAGGEASSVKPNENAKQAKPVEPRAPMSPEMIEAEQERRERESQWQAVKSGPLGDALSLGDRPHNIKYGHGVAKKWMEQAEAMGPEAVKRAGEFAKQRAIENKRQEFAKYAESLGGAGNTMIDPKWSGNAGEPYSVDQAAKEYAEDAESLIAENNPQQWGITKKHLADNPHTHSARLWVSNMLEGKNQLKDLHDLHQHIASPSKQPEASTQPATPAPPTKSGPPGVSENDIPFQVAYNAHAGMSHVPEKRAKQRQAEYVAQMTADWEHLSKLADSPEKKEALAAEFERYRSGFKDKTLAVLHAGSRVMSPMITGPARFPTASNRKRGDAYDKRISELLDFRKRAMAAIQKKLSPESGPVKSSDSNAVETLQKQLDAAQKYQEAAKEVNKIVRSHVASAERDGGPVTFKPGKTRESAIEAIKALGLSEKTASEALKGDYMGRVGIPDYSLKNNNANMRRIKQRIEELSKMKATPAKSEEYSGGVEVHEDPEAARIRIKFPGKPARDAIDKLKRAGFRWSPTEGAWQRHLNSAGRYAVNDVLKSLGHTKQESAAPQSSPVSDDVPEMLPMSDQDDAEPQTESVATEQSPGSSLTGWHKDEFTGLHDAMKRQLTGEGPRRQESLARSLMESSPPAVQKELFRALKSIAPEAHAAIAAKPGIHLHKETFQ